MWRVILGIIVGVALVFVLNVGVETPFKGMFAVPVDEVGGNVDVSTGSITIPSGTTQQPPATGSGTNPPPTSGQQPAPSGQNAGWSQSVTVNANDPNGAVVELPGPGTYTVSVSGSYFTGTHNRSVVAVLFGAPGVSPCGQWSEPCADKWVGDFNAANPTSASMMLSATSVRFVAVDDLSSFGDNTGSVTVTITGN